jgi:hypothetical protein
MKCESIIIKIYLQEIFYVFSGALVIFALMEIVKPGMVIAYVNYNVVLIFWFITGMLILFIRNNKEDKE